MGRYMTGLFKLAHDPSSGARKGVCTGLVQLLHLQPERLAPHLPDIIEYMLRSMQARPDGTLFAIYRLSHSTCKRAINNPGAYSARRRPVGCLSV